jgi:hypothetical protein
LVPIALAISCSAAAAEGGSNPVPGTWSLASNKVVINETNDSGKGIEGVRVKLPPNDVVSDGLWKIGSSEGTCPGGGDDSMLALFELECEFAEWLFGEAIFSMPVSDPDGELTANPPPDLEEEVSENGTTYEGPYAIPPAAPVCTGGQVDKAGSCACPEGTVLVSGTCEKPPEKTPPAPPPSPPANPQPAAPGAQPCSCGKLTVYLTHFITSQATGSTRVEFDVNWTMTCTAGTGNCNGQVKILAPLGARFIEQDGELTTGPPHPKIVAVHCAGPCNETITGKERVAYFALLEVKRHGKSHTVPNPGFTPEGRAGKSFEIRLSILCPTIGNIVKLHLTFDKHGQVDYKESLLHSPGSVTHGL